MALWLFVVASILALSAPLRAQEVQMTFSGRARPDNVQCTTSTLSFLSPPLSTSIPQANNRVPRSVRLLRWQREPELLSLFAAAFLGLLLSLVSTRHQFR